MEEKEEEYLKLKSCKENKSVYKKCEDTYDVQKETKDVMAELIIQLIECNKHLRIIVNTLESKKISVKKIKENKCDAHPENLEIDGEFDINSDKPSIQLQEETDASVIIKVKKCSIVDMGMWKRNLITTRNITM
jgi:hypothetical protein